MPRSKLIAPSVSNGRVLPPLMIDHIDIVVGDWLVNGTAHDVIDFESRIAGIEAVSRDGECVRIFNTPKISQNGRSFEASVSKGSRRHAETSIRPVFGGVLKSAFGVGRVPRAAPEYVRFGLNGNLNLNHFLKAQSYSRLFRPDRPMAQKPLSVTLSGTKNSYGLEYCLADEDNLLIGTPAAIAYASSKPSEDHLIDYIRLIENFLTHEFMQTAYYRNSVSVRHSPYYSLQKIEFAAEFDHPNPIKFVDDIVVPMRSLGTRSRQHRALVRGESTIIQQDSICVSVELSGGCDLVVYAKTNKRVRFEIRFDSSAITALLRKKGNSSRTACTLGALRTIVTTLREIATERLQRALGLLDRLLTPPTSDVTPMQLCAEIGRLLQNDALAHSVLETLRLRGSLASADGSPVKTAAKVLTEAGILMRATARSKVFVPCGKYISAVRELQSSSRPILYQ